MIASTNHFFIMSDAQDALIQLGLTVTSSVIPGGDGTVAFNPFLFNPYYFIQIPLTFSL